MRLLLCRLGLCPCKGGRLVGMFLCRIGLHKWRWQDMRRHSLYVNQVKRCEREGCTRVKHRTIYPKG